MSDIFTGNSFKLYYNTDLGNLIPDSYNNVQVAALAAMPSVTFNSETNKIEVYDSDHTTLIVGGKTVGDLEITVNYIPDNETHMFLDAAAKNQTEFQLIIEYQTDEDGMMDYSILNGAISSYSLTGDKDAVVQKTYVFSTMNVMVRSARAVASIPLVEGSYGVGSNGVSVPQYQPETPEGNSFIKIPSGSVNSPTSADVMGIGLIDEGTYSSIALTKSGALAIYAKNGSTAWTRIVTSPMADAKYLPFSGGTISGNLNITGILSLTNALTVANGGTGAKNITDARTNLSVYSKAETDEKYVPKTTTVNGHTLSSNVTVTKGDVGLGNVTNDAQVKKAGDTMTGALIVDSTLTVNQLSTLSGGYVGQQDAIDIQNQTISLNSLTIPYGSAGNTALYGCPSTGGGANITDKPSGVTGDFLLYVELVRAANANDWTNRQIIVTHVNKKSYTRWLTHTSTTDTWTDWSEQLNGIVPITNGGTGATTATSARNNLGLGSSSTVYFGSLELSAATPFIDFHFNNSTADYTTRLIEQASGTLSLIGNSAISGNLSVQGNVNLTNNLTIANGGTGAGTAAGARTNLEVYSKAEVDGSIARLTLPGISNGNANYYKVATLKDSGASSGYVEFTVYGSGGYGSRVTNVDYITLSARNLSLVTSTNVANYITHTRLTYSTASALRMGMVVNTDKSVDVYIIAPNGYWGGTNAIINAISGGGTYILGDISTKTSTQAWTTTAPTDIVTIPYSELLTNNTTGSSVTYNVGTSGNTIPLLDGSNVWTNSQTIGTSGENKLTIVNSTLRDNGNGGFIISSNSGTTSGNVGLYLRPVGDTVSTIQLLGNNNGWTVSGNTTFNNIVSFTNALSITSGGTGANNASAGWINLLNGRTAVTARNDLGVNTFFSNGRLNTPGTGVYTYDDTRFGWDEKYATVLQLNNQTNTSDAVGPNIWQSYFAFCTSGNLIYASNINGTYKSVRMWSSNNTTVDGSGFIKQASPVIRVVSDVDVMTSNFLEGFTLSGYGAVNSEAESVVIEKMGVGVYKISGSKGLHKDGWQIEVPKDVNGNRLCFVEIETNQDNILTLNVFKPKLDLETGGIIAGAVMDIPAGRWVDIRLEM
ncbi:beta strand repeat-containing protein [Klebsiella michiganensis]|uniref:beta strand repeat-containing protein n=1 Tax=Klebsiella michiganensis TaxID=1134687 RepID=UPI0011E70532|nr:hypothetical protein [Klebsiella michiganensis]